MILAKTNAIIYFGRLAFHFASPTLVFFSALTLEPVVSGVMLIAKERLSRLQSGWSLDLAAYIASGRADALTPLRRIVMFAIEHTVDLEAVLVIGDYRAASAVGHCFNAPITVHFLCQGLVIIGLVVMIGVTPHVPRTRHIACVCLWGWPWKCL